MDSSRRIGGVVAPILRAYGIIINESFSGFCCGSVSPKYPHLQDILEKYVYIYI